MSDLSESVARLRDYLSEMDRVNQSARLQYHDAAHGINDKPLNRSDVQSVVNALTRVTDDQMRTTLRHAIAGHEVGYGATHTNLSGGESDGIAVKALAAIRAVVADPTA